jgi:hypothetical protein
MAIKMQGGTREGSDGAAPSGNQETNTTNNGGRVSTSSEGNFQAATADSSGISESEQHEQAAAQALLRSVAAGPLPAADSLWSDDDDCEY